MTTVTKKKGTVWGTLWADVCSLSCLVILFAYSCIPHFLPKSICRDNLRNKQQACLLNSSEEKHDLIINSIHLILKINNIKINTQQVRGLRSKLVSPSARGKANCQMHFLMGMKSAKLDSLGSPTRKRRASSHLPGLCTDHRCPTETEATLQGNPRPRLPIAVLMFASGCYDKMWCWNFSGNK